jgi:hypothetical protein
MLTSVQPLVLTAAPMAPFGCSNRRCGHEADGASFAVVLITSQFPTPSRSHFSACVMPVQGAEVAAVREHLRVFAPRGLRFR